MAKPSPLHARTPLLAALGGAIRQRRREIGMSQEALALEAEMDRSYVGGIERGEHNIALVNLHKLCVALQLSMADLLARTGF